MEETFSLLFKMSEEHLNLKKDNLCCIHFLWRVSAAHHEFWNIIQTVLDDDRRVQYSLSQWAVIIVRGRKERVQGVCSVGRRGLHRLLLLLLWCRTPLRLHWALERLKSNGGGGERLFLLRRFKDRQDDYRQFDQGICGTFDVQLDLWKTCGHGVWLDLFTVTTISVCVGCLHRL